MRCLTLLLVCLVLSCASAARRNGAKRRHFARRTVLFGGRVVKDGEADWEVSIMKSRSFMCSGSLLRNDVVLTSADCIQGLEPADLLVRAGSTTFKNYGQLRKIRQTIYHPNYSEDSKAYNVALLELIRPFNATTINVSTVNLPDPADELPTYVTVYGWGLAETKNATRITKQLRFSKVRILSARKCSRYLRDVNVDDSVFCTGDREKRMGACSFSLGSPAMGPNDVQYGILTDSGDCSDDPPLTVYTNVITVRDWIDNTMNNELKMPSARNWNWN